VLTRGLMAGLFVLRNQAWAAAPAYAGQPHSSG